ncbi:MAG: beta-lactamase family protein, partial [Anaerolineae bacterium]|nr:beta-lactamase family protein [Anaerolineae bacterium]
TAIMQLVEQGKVDLHTDVNEYLKRLQLPRNYARPVTIADLLTHTAGLDWDLDDIGTVARRASEMQPLAQFLVSQPPARIWPPGKQYLYSNGAYDLLGFVVEEVSGLPFAQYVDENILQPLDMHRTSFLQPPPMSDDLATAYEYVDGAFRAVPLPYYHNPPSRSLTASATDIAHFMLAHLQQGRYGNGRILQESTAREMQAQHFTYRAGEPGAAYGFDEFVRNGVPGISKWGVDLGAHSGLYLLPDQDWGYFISYNGNDGFQFINFLTDQIFDHYYPLSDEPVPPQLPADFQARARRFTGIYRSTGYSHHTVAKLGMLLWGPYPQVTAPGDGTLQVRFSQDDKNILQLVEVGSLFFQSPDGKTRIVFVEDGQGNITHMASGQWVTEKVPWYKTAAFHTGLLGIYVVAFAVMALISPVSSLIRRRRGQPPPVARLPRPTRLLTALAAALNLTMLALMAVLLPQSDRLGLEYGMPPVLAAVLAIPIVTTILSVGALISAGLAWKNRYGSLAGRVAYSLGVVILLAFIPFLLYWNLLGFRW